MDNSNSDNTACQISLFVILFDRFVIPALCLAVAWSEGRKAGIYIKFLIWCYFSIKNHQSTPLKTAKSV